MAKTKRPPEIGTLVRLKSWDGSDDVKVASINPDSEDDYVIVPHGSHALVVGVYTRPWETRDIVPVVSMNAITGWIFNDEWELLDDPV